MTNSDNTYGVFNKQTKIINQKCFEQTFGTAPDTSVAPIPDKTIFASVDEAKSFIFTDEALAVINETCTQIEWALVNDGDGNATQLKKTFAFGTKGGSIATSDDWAEQYNSRKQALIDSNTWMKTYTGKSFTATDSAEHLF
jgi:hypothetical protein